MTEPPGEGADRAAARAEPTPVSRRQRAVGLVAVAILALAGLYTLRDFLPAIVWALVIAIALWPLFQRLALRWPAHRHGLLPALVIAATVLVLALPLVLIGFPIFRDAHEASHWLEQARRVGVPAPPFLQHLPGGAQLTQFWQANLAGPGAMSVFASRAMQGGVLEFGRRFGAAALHRLALVGFMLLALFFVLRHADTVTAQLKTASRRAIGPAGERVALQVVRAVQGTVNGVVLVGLAEGLILGVAYWIAGVPHPALFGLVTALLAMIPFGAYLAIAIAALALLVNDSAVAAMIVAGLGVVVSFLADHFVRPVLIGGATRLPFLWVLLGFLGGFETWGLVGLFIGPALLSVLVLLWREYVGRPRGGGIVERQDTRRQEGDRASGQRAHVPGLGAHQHRDHEPGFRGGEVRAVAARTGEPGLAWRADPGLGPVCAYRHRYDRAGRRAGAAGRLEVPRGQPSDRPRPGHRRPLAGAADRHRDGRPGRGDGGLPRDVHPVRRDAFRPAWAFRHRRRSRWTGPPQDRRVSGAAWQGSCLATPR